MLNVKWYAYYRVEADAEKDAEALAEIFSSESVEIQVFEPSHGIEEYCLRIDYDDEIEVIEFDRITKIICQVVGNAYDGWSEEEFKE